MANSNKKKLQTIILFTFLAIFPFGQLLKMSFQPIDLVVGLAFLYTIIFSVGTPKAVVVFRNFLLAAGFSLLFSLAFFKTGDLFTGFLYLARLTFYVYFISFVFNFSQKNRIKKNLLVNGLMAVSIFSAIFGWIQYFWFPDFRPFTVFGWDDHLFRLTGTFMDPGFTALIFVLGAAITLLSYLRYKKILYLISFILLSVSLAFTYSRAGYLSFIAAALYMGFSEKKMKEIILALAAFAVIVMALPRTAGEGVKLERTASTSARLLNYSETIKIIGKSPLFGIGFNNLCLAKETFFENNEQGLHSCSGSDSSLLLILATTGVVGFIIFLWCIRSLFHLIKSRNLYGKILISSSIALFIHSLFVNSLFYSWVMGWMAVLLAVSHKESREKI